MNVSSISAGGVGEREVGGTILAAGVGGAAARRARTRGTAAKRPRTHEKHAKRANCLAGLWWPVPRARANADQYPLLDAGLSTTSSCNL